MPSLDKKDLKQIKKVIDESIDERVPKIIDERVPKIIDERVPKIIDERVPKIIDERVPKIIDERVPGIVEKVVEPYFAAIQKDFNNVYERFNKIDEWLERIEKLILADHKRRIEKLETEVKELKELLAIK